MQSIIVAGDSLDFTDSYPDHPASAGWVVAYRLVPFKSGPPTSVITLTAAAAGDAFRVQVTAATTAAYAAGTYSWVASATLALARVTVNWGTTKITENPSAVTPGADIRTQAQTAVDDCLEALADMAATAAAGGATAGNRITKRYVIGNREMEFEGTATEIEKQLGSQGGGLLAFWRGELANENAAKNAQLGLSDRRRIYLRAGRA